MNALTRTETGALSPQATPFSLAPRNLEEAFRLADMLAQSDMVPKDFRGKAGNVLIAMQWGYEVGLKPLQSLQNIAVINGRPSMWGDALLALVRSSPLCEYVLEEMGADGVAVCRAKRRGEPEQIRTFSDHDAKVAGLLGKAGPWATSPKRMKQMRARSFALRDVFTDVLKGMDIAEVLVDYSNLDASPAASQRPATLPDLPAELLEAATTAAAAGVESYAKFWTDTGKANRLLIGTKHAEFKAQAEAADQARTVDNEPSDPGHDDFIAGMEAGEAVAP